MGKCIDLDKVFTYHPPTEHPTNGSQMRRYESIRDKAKEFAAHIIDLSPESAEQTHAINKIQEAVMWANAGIARNE